MDIKDYLLDNGKLLNSDDIEELKTLGSDGILNYDVKELGE